MWRLVLDAGLDYDTVFHQMSQDELDEANAAFDYYCELIEKQTHKK